MRGERILVLLAFACAPALILATNPSVTGTLQYPQPQVMMPGFVPHQGVLIVPGEIKIPFRVASDGHVTVKVNTDTGSIILEDGELPAGPHAVFWDGKDPQGRDVKPNVYEVTLQSNDGLFRRGVVVAKP